jgi:hypothetical protein
MANILALAFAFGSYDIISHIMHNAKGTENMMGRRKFDCRFHNGTFSKNNGISLLKRDTK